MKSFAAAAALVAAVPFVLGQGLQVNSLSGVVECEPILVSWSGGSPPYYVSLIPAGQPSAPAMKQFPPQQGTSFTWNVDLPAGTTFSTELKDASGQPVYSGIQTVESGDSTSCANTSVFEGGSSTPASSQTPAVAAAASTTGMTMSTSNHATSTASGSSSGSGSATSSSSVTHITAAAQSSAGTTSTATATATATQNAAPQGSSVNAFGIAGLLGLVGAALF